jgi:hypothetical protein
MSSCQWWIIDHNKFQHSSCRELVWFLPALRVVLGIDQVVEYSDTCIQVLERYFSADHGEALAHHLGKQIKHLQNINTCEYN